MTPKITKKISNLMLICHQKGILEILIPQYLVIIGSKKLNYNLKRDQNSSNNPDRDDWNNDDNDW